MTREMALEYLSELLDQRREADLPDTMVRLLEADADLARQWQEMLEAERALRREFNACVPATVRPVATAAIMQGLQNLEKAEASPAWRLYPLAAAAAFLLVAIGLAPFRSVDREQPQELLIPVTVPLPTLDLSAGFSGTRLYISERRADAFRTAQSIVEGARRTLPQLPGHPSEEPSNS